MRQAIVVPIFLFRLFIINRALLLRLANNESHVEALGTETVVGGNFDSRSTARNLRASLSHIPANSKGSEGHTYMDVLCVYR